MRPATCPQQPPTIRAPACTASCVLAHQLWRAGVDGLGAGEVRDAAVALEIRYVWRVAPVIASNETRMSLAPTPQLAPIDNRRLGQSVETRGDRSPGISPIIV